MPQWSRSPNHSNIHPIQTAIGRSRQHVLFGMPKRTFLTVITDKRDR